ncbi:MULTISPECIES: hypothetical protein [Amycolatopsis]|uniref:Uncharacterized protein n=1 Tax=Amycolatopsis dendrobii TaxID=2760662 RepID=A0A7W3VWN1_9PSEU|nr:MULTISPECIES: hypothetical protein [Amycolatopsis]MBB1154475.1 hypothetical protein [Amycolatopsis dendrobii]UKD51149.1 hypothetical protein L3Q65_24790 [Amycolatopsis sp. FU40]
MEKEVLRSRQIGGPAVTSLLWLIFIAGAATNSIGGFTGLDHTFGMIAGGIAVVCLVILVVRFAARNKD